MFKLLSLLSLLLIGVVAAAEFKITSPSKEIFWVANSDNVVAWTGTPPGAQFTVFLANPDINKLTDRTAMVAVLDSFRTSYLMSPGMAHPGTGYTVQLTDLLNSTNIYAESEPFEIKPVGSAYPTATPQGADSPATASQSGSQTAKASATESDTAQKAAETGNENAAVALSGWGLGAACIMGLAVLALMG